MNVTEGSALWPALIKWQGKKKYKCRESKDSHTHWHLSQISEEKEAMETLKGDAPMENCFCSRLPLWETENEEQWSCQQATSTKV